MHRWSPTRRLVAVSLGALVLVAAGFGSVRPQPPSPSGAQLDRPDAITVLGADVGQREMLEWSLGRISELDGALPDLVVDFAPAGDCDGLNGFYTASTGRLEFCNDGGGDLPPRQTMLHELAHAWTFHRLDTSTIERFLRLRGLDEWRHTAEVAWWQSGQEQAAEIIAWGLMGDRPFESKWVRWEPCAELIVGFRLLTGREPDQPLRSCRIVGP